jgi:hypothetical protein
MVSNVFDESYQLDFDKAIEQSRLNLIDLKDKKKRINLQFHRYLYFEMYMKEINPNHIQLLLV